MKIIRPHHPLLHQDIEVLKAGQHQLVVQHLDGGYIARGLLGKRTGWVTAATLLAMILMGIFAYPLWLVLVFWLAVGVITRRRAPKLCALFFWRRPHGDEGATTLDLERRELLVAVLVAIAIFSLCFTIAPVEIANGS